MKWHGGRLTDAGTRDIGRVAMKTSVLTQCMNILAVLVVPEERFG